MPRGSSPKRERQYEHILDAERERGVPEDRAEEIAARTVTNSGRVPVSQERLAPVEDRYLFATARGYRRTHGGSAVLAISCMKRRAAEHRRTLPHDEVTAGARVEMTLGRTPGPSDGRVAPRTRTERRACRGDCWPRPWGRCS